MSATPDEALAAMAEAATDWHLNGHGPVSANCSRIMLERALAAALGWVLVPVEPTAGMAEAGGRARVYHRNKNCSVQARAIYAAMLAAAPKVGER